jgi:hypothetical protein
VALPKIVCTAFWQIIQHTFFAGQEEKRISRLPSSKAIVHKINKSVKRRRIQNCNKNLKREIKNLNNLQRSVPTYSMSLSNGTIIGPI